MIKAIAIDDEPIALDIIDIYSQKVGFLSLEQKLTNAFDAVDYIKENTIDLLFLDIKMPDISGIEFFNSLTKKPLVVFTTAYSEHAVTGFELDAVDYLLKPFLFPRFLKACNKAYDLFQSQQAEGKSNYIFLKDGFDMVKIDFENILYIEATGNYVRFVSKSKEILTRMTIKDCLHSLPSNLFVQVHRSFIIALHNTDRMEKHQVHIGEYIIPIASSYIQTLKETLTEK